jgi:hypothetical protein
VTWLWIAIVSAIGAILAETIRQRGGRAEHAFFSDDERVALEMSRIKKRKWIRPLSRIGAMALLIMYAGMIGLFALVLPGAIAISVFSDGTAPAWFGAGLIVLLAMMMAPAPLGITATILCRCERCAGWLFDNGQPRRKGFVDASRENWRFVQGQGRCPRCGEAA